MKKNSKKYIAAFIILPLLIGILSYPLKQARARSNTQKVKCVITGYYSPLPGQIRYVTGSLVGDKRLNGNGTNGADGTPVYPGMIAAPKSIPFGTKVNIPGIGVGTVHDRGGAIQTYKNNEANETVYRFDVWMGKGDEGLKRALDVGIRSKTCTIHFGSNTPESIALNPVVIKKESYPDTSSLFTEDLYLDMKNDQVKKLQEILNKLGFMEYKATGYFGENTYKAVVSYQIERGIIKTNLSFGAGNVGPQTKQSLTRDLREPEQRGEDNIKKENMLIIAMGMGKNAEGDDVMRLQEILKILGHYHGEVTGIYDYATIKAVFDFQIKNNIISDETEYGAGYFGPKTFDALADLIEEKSKNLVERQVYGKKMIVYERKVPVINKKIFVIRQTDDVFIAKKTNLKILTKGDSNQIVLSMQKNLYELGYLQVTPTGYYGDLTTEAVWKFQYDNKILGDRNHKGAGDIGTKTERMIEKKKNERIIAMTR